MSKDKSLRRNLSFPGAWAFAIGTSVGWGSLVVTSSTYLAQAGPIGSVLGLIVGAAVMLLICFNYAYMMKNYPEAGGAYAYAREVFGYDQGFLVSWFVLMTYFAMLWANATSLPLFGRIFLGDLFSVGKMYSLFGYDVYLGEAMLSMAAIVLIGLLCTRSKKWTNIAMLVMALLFSAGIVIAFAASLFGGGAAHMSPAFLPDRNALSQIVKISVISPWAFIGFESISNQTEEFDFSHEKIHRLLVIAVASTTLLYIFITLLSVSAYPPQFSSWLDYIANLDSLSGIEALPAFYGANHYLGQFGVLLLMFSLLALVITSLIGNMTALSRILFAMARDSILPERFAALNRQGIPSGSVFLVAAVSCIVPFIGRTAIGWIVDVTTIGAVLIYGFVSASTMVMAKKMEDRTEIWSGRAGCLIMVLLGACFLFPNFISKGSLATETYFLFIVWSVLGFLFFRSILHRDKKKRFGGSVSVWIAFLGLVLVISLIWMRQSMLTSYSDTIEEVVYHYEEAMEDDREADASYIIEKMGDLEDANTRTMVMAVGMFGFALIIMLTNHTYLNKRTRETEMIASRDSMTGVMNKLAYSMREKDLDTLINEGEAGAFSIVVCDVNGLKKINDTLGHKAGDEYIRKACTMICDIFQHSPVFRVGGDEFVAILKDRDYAVRKELMSTLQDRSIDHIGTNEAVVSGGISDFDPEKDHSVHEVFQRADENMYATKKYLKSLGAVTRDDESDAAEDKNGTQSVSGQMPVLSLDEQIISIRRKVLIVEDEIVNQQLLGSVLENDYEILYAADGGEALEAIREHKDELALVLLDLMMPQMNGRELLKVLNADGTLRSIPVVVLTADQEAELECLNLGAVDFIPKPYPIWEIVKARVDRVIELSENRGIIRSTERDGLTGLFNIDYFYR
ncbi:MAG: amino acid permease [Lachnospiraceae bacterium]|nr:amino acid permease [Lachnospiraceae bacterium]